MNKRGWLEFRYWILVALAICQTLVAGQAATSGHVPGTAVRDMAGQTVNPFERDKGKVIVLIFGSIDCPISNAYAPKIRRLCEQFEYSGVVFWLVHGDPDESLDMIENHRKQFRYPCAALSDPGHELVRKAQARVTPEAAVFDREGRLVYHGRIDDQYVELGKRRPEAIREDLRLVLEGITKGQPLPISSTRAIGCSIASLK